MRRVDGRCSWCRDPMPVPDRPQAGGRTKLFCSPACKQAEYRHRTDPDRYPDAQTWAVNNRGLYARSTARSKGDDS